MNWQNNLSAKELKHLRFHFSAHWSISLDDLDISDARGYWKNKKKCCDSNRKYSCIGGPNCQIKHTYTYFDMDGRDKKGRFLSPYRTWRRARYGDRYG